MFRSFLSTTRGLPLTTQNQTQSPAQTAADDWGYEAGNPGARRHRHAGFITFRT
jgi:hypothetical protein